MDATSLQEDLATITIGSCIKLCTMYSLLDDNKEGDSVHSNSLNNKRGTATTCSESESRRSNLSTDDSLALEVGLSAHEYLEECFYTEVSVLDREKFYGIPEIVKSDLSIMVSEINIM